MDNIRKPAVSGMWYPSDKSELKEYLDTLFKQAEDIELDGELWALVAPHAGYVYSGWVAAYAFKQLMKDADKYRDYTFVLIGPSHRVSTHSIAVWAEGAFETPLGKAKIDENLANKLVSSNPSIEFNKTPHLQEHCLESEIPFLQYIFGDDLKIVPIVYGDQSASLVNILTEVLKNLDKEYKTIYIVSSDMSHYHPYDVAVEMDKRGIEYVLSLDTEGLINNVINGNVEFCGFGAVLTLMEMAKAKTGSKVALLKYANSGDVPVGEKSRVVGYAALAFTQTEENNSNDTSIDEEESTEYSLTDEQKLYLLKLARRTIEHYIKTGETIEEKAPKDPEMLKDRAVFVTLHEFGQLRGCIGEMIASQPLYKSVISRAIAAATQDPRFRAVTENELDKIDIEVSVLSPLTQIDNYKDIEMGKHGVYIRKGYRSGVFLPQVATETGWSRDKFLQELCSQKAGLSPDAYKDPETELYVYTVVLFSEREFGLK
ncbi:AmmeMemoRadiSam system protein B [bacterium]|nr:AmmeMemoRadiSam system protein B [bacterium]